MIKLDDDRMMVSQTEENNNLDGCTPDDHCSDCDCMCPLNSDSELRDKFDKIEW
jgi:hypothetical protein